MNNANATRTLGAARPGITRGRWIAITAALVGCGTSIRQSTLPPQAAAVYESEGSCGASTASVISHVETRVRELSSVGPVKERPDTSAIKTGKGLNIIKGVKIEQVANGVRVTYVNGERNLDTKGRSLTESVGLFKVTFSADGGRTRITVTPPSVLEHSVAHSKYFVNIAPLLDDEEAVAEFTRIRDGLMLQSIG